MPGTKDTRNVFSREPKLSDVVKLIIGLIFMYLPRTDGQILSLSPTRSFSSMRNSEAHSIPMHGLTPLQELTAAQSTGNGGINLADSFFLNRVRHGDTDAIMRLGELRETVDTPMSLLHNFFRTFSRPNPRQRTGLFSLLRNLAVARGLLPNTLAIGSNIISTNQRTETPIQNRNVGVTSRVNSRNTGVTSRVNNRNAGVTSDRSNRNAVNNANVNNRPIETRSHTPQRNFLGRVSDGQINTFQNGPIVQTSLEVVDSREVDISTRMLPSGRSQRQSSFGRGISHHRNDVFRAANQGRITSTSSVSGRDTNVQNINMDINREQVVVPMQGLPNQELPVNNDVNLGSTAINQGNFWAPNNIRESHINSSTMTVHEFNNRRVIVPRQSGFPMLRQESRVPNNPHVGEMRSENSPNANIRLDSNSVNTPINESLPLRHQKLSILDRAWGTSIRNGNSRNAEFNHGNDNIAARNDPEHTRQTLVTLNTEINTDSNGLPNAELNLTNFGNASMNVSDSIEVGSNLGLDTSIASNNVGSRMADVQRNSDVKNPSINSEMLNNISTTRNRTVEQTLQTHSRNGDVIDNVAIPSKNLNPKPVFWKEKKNGGRITAPPLDRRRGLIKERPVITKILTFPPIEDKPRLNETPPRKEPPDDIVNRTINATDTKLDTMSSHGTNVIRAPKIPSALGFILNLPSGVPLNSAFSQNESTNDSMLTTTPVNMHSATEINTTPSFEHMSFIQSIGNLPFSEATSLQEIIALFSNTSQTSNSPIQPSTVIDSIDFREIEPQVSNQNVSTTNFNGNDFPETTTAKMQSNRDFILQKVGHIELEPKDHVLQLVGDMNLTLAEPEYNIQRVGDLNLGRRRQFVMEVTINGSAQSNKVLMQRVGNNDIVSGERIRVHGSGDVRLVTKERVILERLGYITFQTDPLRNPPHLINSSKPIDEVRSVFRIEPLNQTQNNTGLLFLGNETNVMTDKKHNETILQFVGDVLTDIPEDKLNVSQSSMADINSDSAAINAKNSNGDNVTFNAETLVKTSNNMATENMKSNLNKTFAPEELLKTPISSEFPSLVLSEIQATSIKQEVTPRNDTKSLPNIVLNPIGRIFTTVRRKSDIAKENMIDQKIEKG